MLDNLPDLDLKLASLNVTRLVIGICACPAIGDGLALDHLLRITLQLDARTESRPLLPWVGDSHTTSDDALLMRCQRLKRAGKTEVIVDLGAHYFPHLFRLLSLDATLKVIHVKTTPMQVLDTFEILTEAQPLLYDHWSEEPGAESHRDIDWARTFPKYGTAGRDAQILRYADECIGLAGAAREAFPDRVLEVTLDDLKSEKGILKVASFIGVKATENEQALPKVLDTQIPKTHPRRGLTEASVDDPGRCIVLVPYSTYILPETERQLRQLEENGYCVRRQGGISAIDQGRSQMATDALIDGFEETLWIDSDI